MRKFITVLVAFTCMVTMSISAYGSMANEMYGTNSGGHVAPTDPKNPGVIRYCYNTYYTYSHIGNGTLVNEGWHTLPNGVRCHVTEVAYTHQKTCTSCGANVGTYSKSCTLQHSYCGTKTDCWE